MVATGLFCHHEFGVPIWPGFIMLTSQLLVLAMRGGSAAKRTSKVSRRRKRCLVGVQAPRQSRGDLLQQPGVAVGVTKGGERDVTPSRRITSAQRRLSRWRGGTRRPH